MQRSVLLVSSCWWPFTARIALRFAEMGWRVDAICPPGHPLRATAAVARLYDYPVLRPVAALHAAIRAARPDLIVPCDDRVVAQLHELHVAQSAADPATGEAIVRSLGRPDSYPLAAQRSALIAVARDAGLRAPQTRVVADADELDAAIAAFGLPLMLKMDGSWGASGVRMARTRAEAHSLRAGLARRPRAATALRLLLIDRDRYSALPSLRRPAAQVNAQVMVRGRPANCVVACQDGAVLAAIHVEVLRTERAMGPSCVVRVIEHPEMARTAETLVRGLGLSGFHGFDFIIEDGTGHAHLIEMNPRGTPLSHLALGPGRDPVAALAARIERAPPPLGPAVTDNDVIAFFPQARRHAADSQFLSAGYHDVPWQDPGLMRELSRPAYGERGILARLFARFGAAGVRRRHDDGGRDER